MELIINDPNPVETFKLKNAVVWQLHRKKIIQPIIIQYVISAVLLIIGITSFNKYESITYPVSISKDLKTIHDKVIYINFHILSSVGIVFFLLVTYNLFLYLKDKKKFFNSIQLAEKNFNNQANSTIIINDTFVSFNSHLYKMEIDWGAITGYKLYNELLFLNKDESLSNSVCIRKNLISEEKFSELIVFIKSRVPEIK